MTHLAFGNRNFLHVTPMENFLQLDYSTMIFSTFHSLTSPKTKSFDEFS
jgi:hypothetical protein